MSPQQRLPDMLIGAALQHALPSCLPARPPNRVREDRSLPQTCVNEPWATLQAFDDLLLLRPGGRVIYNVSSPNSCPESKLSLAGCLMACLLGPCMAAQMSAVLHWASHLWEPAEEQVLALCNLHIAASLQGPLGHNSCNLVRDLQNIPGVPMLGEGVNPATWALQVSTSADLPGPSCCGVLPLPWNPTPSLVVQLVICIPMAPIGPAGQRNACQPSTC